MASYEDGEVESSVLKELRQLLEQLINAYKDPASTKEQLLHQTSETSSRFIEAFEHQVELTMKAEQEEARLEEEVAAVKELIEELEEKIKLQKKKYEQLKALRALSRGAVTEASTQTEKDDM